MVAVIRKTVIDAEQVLDVDTAEDFGRTITSGVYVLAPDDGRADYGLTERRGPCLRSSLLSRTGPSTGLLSGQPTWFRRFGFRRDCSTTRATPLLFS